MEEVRKVSGKMQLIMEAAGGSTGEIGFTKGLGNKEAAGGSTGEIGVTKAVLVNKEAAGGSTGETKAEQREAAGTAMVTEANWIDYVILYKPDQERLVPKQQERKRKAEPLALVTKETVPDSFVRILMERRPFEKLPPLSDMYSSYLSKHAPEVQRLFEEDMVKQNCCIDLHCDVLRQQAEKGFAEVGVDFTSGVKKIFVLP